MGPRRTKMAPERSQDVQECFQDACKMRSDTSKTAEYAGMLQLTTFSRKLEMQLFLKGLRGSIESRWPQDGGPTAQDGARMHAKCMGNTHK